MNPTRSSPPSGAASKSTPRPSSLPRPCADSHRARSRRACWPHSGTGSTHAVSATVSDPRPLMLGKGWFPDQLGGLDRYYRSLLEHLPEASGIVIGADTVENPRVTAVSGHEQPLARRLVACWRAAQRAAEGADVVDVHFALYALAPVWLGKLAAQPVILHF